MARARRVAWRPAREQGITLVEMCLALVVLALVAASIATAFIAASDVVEKNAGRIELVQAGRAAMSRLLAELGTATAIEARADNSLRVYCEGTTSNGSFARRVEFWVADGTLWRQVEGESAQALAEHVTGLTTTGLTFWSTLSSSADIVAPQVGPAAWTTGPVNWRSVRFGDGFWSKANTNGRLFIPTDGVLDNAQGTIEFWFRPEYSQLYVQKATDKYLLDTAPGGGAIQLFFQYTTRQMRFCMNGSASCVVAWDPTWVAGQVVHVAVVWDCTGRQIGGGRTMALYIDGVRCETAAETTTWTPVAFGSTVSLGEYDLFDGEATFENIRIYTYCKTDFTDRYVQTASSLMRVRLDMTDEKTGQTFSLSSGVTVP
jgi:type II secretory pathway pseudopilin PulG